MVVDGVMKFSDKVSLFTREWIEIMLSTYKENL